MTEGSFGYVYRIKDANGVNMLKVVFGSRDRPETCKFYFPHWLDMLNKKAANWDILSVAVGGEQGKPNALNEIVLGILDNNAEKLAEIITKFGDDDK